MRSPFSRAAALVALLGLLGTLGAVTGANDRARAASSPPSTAPPTGYPVLGVGSTGAFVSLSEGWLNSAGTSIVVDGVFDTTNDTAVRQFQRSQNLEVTGTMDATTWSRLDRVAHPELRRGSKGSAVRYLQKLLGLVGHPVNVNGVYGPETVRAVRAVESSWSLPADGVTDLRTWEALEARANPVTAAPPTTTVAPTSTTSTSTTTTTTTIAPTTTTSSSTTTTTAATTTTTSAAPTTTTVAATSVRDAGLWPFTVTSPWNHPMGSGARYEAATDPQTANLLRTDVTPWINHQRYSFPTYSATDADPVHRVTWNSRLFEFRAPADAVPAQGTDAHLVVISPDRLTLHEMWNLEPTASPYKWTAGYIVVTDLRSDGLQDGVRAYGGSAFGGLIRAHELSAGEIPHAIALGISNHQLELGPVWPATRQDGNAASTYSGLNPMGTLAAIPPSVDVTSLGLSREGLMLAQALQRYGGYVVDRAGAFVAYVEPSAPTAHVDALRRDIGKIRAELRVVTNNTSSTPGGGGMPIAPWAPPI
jgi:peptidoglycan hydrolase-like protein with peptidoglycan-binding domain